jgi:hypothetical protein
MVIITNEDTTYVMVIITNEKDTPYDTSCPSRS